MQGRTPGSTVSKLKAWFSSHGLWRAAVCCKSKAIQQLMKNLCVFQACDFCSFLHKRNGGEKLLPPLGREQLSCIWQFRNLIYLQFTAGHLETILFFHFVLLRVLICQWRMIPLAWLRILGLPQQLDAQFRLLELLNLDFGGGFP